MPLTSSSVINLLHSKALSSAETPSPLKLFSESKNSKFGYFT